MRRIREAAAWIVTMVGMITWALEVIIWALSNSQGDTIALKLRARRVADVCSAHSLSRHRNQPSTIPSSTRKIVSRFQTYWSIQLHPEISCHLINGIWSKYADVAKNVGQQNVCMRVQMSKRYGVCVSEFGHIKYSAKYLNNFYLSFNRPFFKIYANILDNL